MLIFASRHFSKPIGLFIKNIRSLAYFYDIKGDVVPSQHDPHPYIYFKSTGSQAG